MGLAALDPPYGLGFRPFIFLWTSQTDVLYRRSFKQRFGSEGLTGDRVAHERSKPKKLQDRGILRVSHWADAQSLRVLRAAFRSVLKFGQFFFRSEGRLVESNDASDFTVSDLPRGIALGPSLAKVTTWFRRDD